jgi:hypothetical protein
MSSSTGVEQKMAESRTIYRAHLGFLPVDRVVFSGAASSKATPGQHPDPKARCKLGLSFLSNLDGKFLKLRKTPKSGTLPSEDKTRSLVSSS